MTMVISPSPEIPAGEFKAHCLRLMDEVRESHREIVVTKHGRRVAKLVPVEDAPADSFGAMRGSVVYDGDIVAPDPGAWERSNGA